MLFNAKNVQFDTEKIREAVLTGEIVGTNLNNIIEKGIGGVPVGVTIPLGDFIIEKDAVDKQPERVGMDKAFFMRGANQKLNKYMHMPYNNKNKIICSIQASTENHLYYYKRMGAEFCTVQQIELDTFNAYKNILLVAGKEDELECIADRITKLAKHIVSKYFGYGYSLTMWASKSVVGSLSINTLSSILELLRDIENKLNTEKRTGVPIIIFERLKPVVAVNIIKIIRKGTDTDDNYYTGECTNLVLEALVTKSDMSNKIIMDNMAILKSNIMTINEYRKTIYRDGALVGLRNNKADMGTRFTSSNIEVSKAADRMMCTHLIGLHYINHKSIQSYKDWEEEYIKYRNSDYKEDIEKDVNSAIDDLDNVNESTFKEDEEDNTWVYLPTIVVNEAGNIIRQESTINSCSGLLLKHVVINEDELVRLAIPVGVDLSNSFKAKYI